MLALVFILILLVLGLVIFNYKKASIVILSITLIYTYSVGSGLVPAILIHFLESPYAVTNQPMWAKRNAIVVLGSGCVKVPNTSIIRPSKQAFARIYEGASLYHDCKQHSEHCLIIVSGGDALKTGESEASVYKRVLMRLGIEPANIILEPNSMNTYKNAEYTSKLLQDHFDKVFLVTSSMHLKRAVMYFAHFNIPVIPISSDYFAISMTIVPNIYNFLIADYAMHEYSGILRYYLYNLLGWNALVPVHVGSP